MYKKLIAIKDNITKETNSTKRLIRQYIRQPEDKLLSRIKKDLASMSPEQLEVLLDTEYEIGLLNGIKPTGSLQIVSIGQITKGSKIDSDSIIRGINVLSDIKEGKLHLKKADLNNYKTDDGILFPEVLNSIIDNKDPNANYVYTTGMRVRVAKELFPERIDIENSAEYMLDSRPYFIQKYKSINSAIDTLKELIQSGKTKEYKDLYKLLSTCKTDAQIDIALSFAGRSREEKAATISVINYFKDPSSHNLTNVRGALGQLDKTDQLPLFTKEFTLRIPLHEGGFFWGDGGNSDIYKLMWTYISLRQISTKPDIESKVRAVEALEWIERNSNTKWSPSLDTPFHRRPLYESKIIEMVDEETETVIPELLHLVHYLDKNISSAIKIAIAKHIFGWKRIKTDMYRVTNKYVDNFHNSGDGNIAVTYLAELASKHEFEEVENLQKDFRTHPSRSQMLIDAHKDGPEAYQETLESLGG